MRRWLKFYCGFGIFRIPYVNIIVAPSMLFYCFYFDDNKVFNLFTILSILSTPAYINKLISLFAPLVSSKTKTKSLNKLRNPTQGKVGWFGLDLTFDYFIKLFCVFFTLSQLSSFPNKWNLLKKYLYPDGESVSGFLIWTAFKRFFIYFNILL
jgi:hypothetical protein